MSCVVHRGPNQFRRGRFWLKSAVWLLAFFSVSAYMVRAGPIHGTLETVAPELSNARKRSNDTKEQIGSRIDELEQAFFAFQKRDYESCLELLRVARKKEPDLPPARLMLARFFLSQNQVAEGRAALEQAAAETPQYPAIYLTFGNLALADGHVTDALVHFEKAQRLADDGQWSQVRRRPFLALAHNGLAAVAERRKDWSSARIHLAAWLDVEPTSVEARQRLARALFALGKSTDAYEQFQQAFKEDPTLDPPAVSMGWLYAQKGDLDRAVTWMQQAVTDHSGDPGTLRALAICLFRQGNAEKAQKHAEAAAKLDPDSKETKVVQGLIARSLKQYAKAESLFQAVYQESPGDSSAANQLALVLVEQPDQAKHQRALQLAEMNVRLYPQSPEALSTLGWVYYRLGRLEQAERALQSAMTAGPASGETAYYLAHVMSDRGRPEMVRQLLKKALLAEGTFLFRKDAEEWLKRIGE